MWRLVRIRIWLRMGLIRYWNWIRMGIVIILIRISGRLGMLIRSFWRSILRWGMLIGFNLLFWLGRIIILLSRVLGLREQSNICIGKLKCPMLSTNWKIKKCMQAKFHKIMRIWYRKQRWFSYSQQYTTQLPNNSNISILIWLKLISQQNYLSKNW